MKEDTVKLYHYTDEAGYRALTSGEEKWYPSTGLPLDLDSSFEVHSTSGPSLAAKTFYRDVFARRDYRTPEKNPFHDIDYGPGWYVTNLAASTSTRQLLDSLWQGKQSYVEKIRYWICVMAASHRIEFPDKARPNVLFLPIFDRHGMRGDPPKPYGQSTSSVLLTEAGSRSEAGDGDVQVKRLLHFEPPIELIPPFVSIIDGWSLLDPDSQANILGYLGMDSGLPGIPFPEVAVGVDLTARQLFAIVQLALKSLGSESSLYDSEHRDYRNTENVFALDLWFEIEARGRRGRILANCRQQKSPVRLEDVEQLFERMSSRDADRGVIFTTSTFSQSSVKRANVLGIVLVLVSAKTETDHPRSELRIAIMDGEVVQYLPCSFWLPEVSMGRQRFVEIRRNEDVLSALKWMDLRRAGQP